MKTWTKELVVRSFQEKELISKSAVPSTDISPFQSVFHNYDRMTQKHHWNKFVRNWKLTLAGLQVGSFYRTLKPIKICWRFFSKFGIKWYTRMSSQSETKIMKNVLMPLILYWLTVGSAHFNLPAVFCVSTVLPLYMLLIFIAVNLPLPFSPLLPNPETEDILPKHTHWRLSRIPYERTASIWNKQNCNIIHKKE